MKRKLLIWITMVTVLFALAIPLLRTAAARPVPPEHPEYHAALDNLRDARRHLEKAMHDGRGHREEAIRAIDHAIHECEESLRILH
jgi:hypothetical protein